MDVSDALEGVAAASVRVRNACCLFGGNMRQIYRARKGDNVFWRFWRQARTDKCPHCRGTHMQSFQGPLAYISLTPSHERSWGEVSSARTKAPRHQGTKAFCSMLRKHFFPLSAIQCTLNPDRDRGPLSTGKSTMLHFLDHR